jgi:hypothetical protein
MPKRQSGRCAHAVRYNTEWDQNRQENAQIMSETLTAAEAPIHKAAWSLFLLMVMNMHPETAIYSDCRQPFSIAKF